MKWVKLSEKKPRYKDCVLFYDIHHPYRHYIGRLMVGPHGQDVIDADTYEYDHYIELEFVDSWMPLPTGPNEINTISHKCDTCEQSLSSGDFSHTLCGGCYNDLLING